MSSRRTAQVEKAAITRRRLELLSAELAALRGTAPDEDDPADGVDAPVSGLPDGAATLSAELPAGPGTAEAPQPAPLPRGRHARRPLGPGSRAAGWLHDRLPPTLQGRVRLGVGHLSLVALLVALGLTVTAWWVVRAGDQGQLIPTASGPGEQARPAGTAPQLVTPVAEAAPSHPTQGESGTGVSGTGEGGTVVVDVAGKVRRPGIVSLPAGARVVDALEAAGGPRQGVDLIALNLARVLVDGEQIVVGVPPPPGVAAPAASAPGAAAGAGGPLVNLNTADQAQLEELPGVGPVTAAAILEWRTEHGPFTTVDELLEVSGIGEARLAEIAPHVTL